MTGSSLAIGVKGEVVSSEMETRIRVMENGPYKVDKANLLKMQMILNVAGRPVRWKRAQYIKHSQSYELCRCGASSNKPFCDWTHATTGFVGTETADRVPTATRQKSYQGQGLVMMDVKSLCVHAGFCVTEKTEVWDLVDQAPDPTARAQLINIIRNCPSGRLEYTDETHDAPVEEGLSQEIGIVEDGPLYARGRIVVESSSGQCYELRNRVTLCRCGASKNKPFCNGMHAEVGFRDSE